MGVEPGPPLSLFESDLQNPNDTVYHVVKNCSSKYNTIYHDLEAEEGKEGLGEEEETEKGPDLEVKKAFRGHNSGLPSLLARQRGPE